MDKVPVLRTQIKLVPETLPISSPTLTGGIPPPLFINSVNELSNISTALSTFLNRYNDLHNHINFINSSLDSLFTNPSQSALTHSTNTLCDHKLTEDTEAVISELNPNGTVSNCLRSCDDNVITLANSSDLKTSVETVLETSSDPNEAVVSEQNPNSSKVAEEINDVFKNSQEIDTLKKLKETETGKKPVKIDISKNPEESDTLQKPVETDMSRRVEEIDDVLKNSEEIDETSKKPEEIDEILKKPKEIDDISRKPEGTDALKKPNEIDVSKKPEELDGSKKLAVTDSLKKPNEVDVSKKHVEIDILNKQNDIDASKKPEELDSSKKLAETNDTLKKHEGSDISKKPEEIDVSKKLEKMDVLKKPKETDILKKADNVDALEKPEEADTSKKPVVSVLEFLCKNMCGRELRTHVGAHISEMNELREEIAKALKLAKDPAKLVLDCIGRFFLQGSRAYYNGANRNEQIASRLASVLILECFVTISSDDIEIAKGDKEYATEAAIDWRQRMIKEGGLRYMDEVDARGLLLLISGFGIPDRVFTNANIRDLLRASNVKGISSTLCHSIILISKIPEVINWMVKNNLEVEAADIAYTFWLEDKCHPDTILKTFLHKRSKDILNGSSYQVIVEKMQLLSDLKSIRRCLEAHKVDPLSLHLDFEISEKIQYLEQAIDEVNYKSTEENSTQKRKVKEIESPRNMNHQEAKRTCFSHEYVPHEQNYIDHYSMSPYNRSTQPSSSYFDRNLPNNYVTTYSAPSVYSASALPPNITSSVAGGLASSYGTSIYGGPVDPMMHTPNIRPYDWDEDSALVSKYLSQPYPSQRQTYYSHSSTTGLYGRPPGWPPLESLPGLPDSSPSRGFFGRRGPSSDLYGFADTVGESESYRGSRAG